MKIVVTGAAGFLGLHIAKYLKQKIGKDKNTHITLIDIAPFEKREYKGSFSFVKADVRDKRRMRELVAGADYVIHAAAGLPLWKAKDIMDINIEGTRNILEASYREKVKRVVHISSTAVYGVPKVHPIYESAPRVGVGPYGKSKIEAENLCFAYIKKGLPVTIIRPKTFVGTHRLGVFEILFDWVHDGKRIPVIGNGGNRYQLLDVDDLVEAIWLFLQKKGQKYDGAFNIGAAEFNTVRKDLQTLFQYAKSGSRLLSTPAWPIKKALWFFEKIHLSPLYQWVYDTADKDSFVSIDKIKKTLKWKPKYSNAEALTKSYQWYLDHYKEIKSRGSGVTHTLGWKQGILGFFKKFL